MALALEYRGDKRDTGRHTGDEIVVNARYEGGDFRQHMMFISHDLAPCDLTFN